MSKWGLLRGAGQGIAQAGTMLTADRLDQMKEERLQKYQKEMQGVQFEREDKLRAEDQGIQMQRDSLAQANLITDREDRRTDSDRSYSLQMEQFEQSKLLVDKQITRINQEIDMGRLDLDQRTQLNDLWNQMREAPDPETRDALYEQYRVLTGTDKDDRFSAVTLYGEENDMGVQTRQSGILNNRTGQITPALPGSEGERPSLEDLMGAPAAEGQSTVAPESQGNPSSHQQGAGLLRRPSSSELSQELGVGVNPRISEQISNVASLPGRVIDSVIQNSAPAYTQWVKGMIAQDKVDQVNFLNRHAYQAALESGQLNEREAGIVRRLLGQQ
jgi:hypothetical protein